MDYNCPFHLSFLPSSAISSFVQNPLHARTFPWKLSLLFFSSGKLILWATSFPAVRYIRVTFLLQACYVTRRKNSNLCYFSWPFTYSSTKVQSLHFIASDCNILHPCLQKSSTSSQGTPLLLFWIFYLPGHCFFLLHCFLQNT